MTITLTQPLLKRIMPQIPLKSIDALYNALVKHMTANQMLTIPRAAAFLSQIAHESGDLRWFREWDVKGNHFAQYEGRATLGNNQAGDGEKFCGRGAIQLTGRTNYTKASAAAFQIGQVATATEYVDNPDLVETPDHGIWVSIWYWNNHKLNEAADKMAIDQISYEINAGRWSADYDASLDERMATVRRINGRRERIDIYLWALGVLAE